MSIFSTILEKLGLHKPATAAPPAQQMSPMHSESSTPPKPTASMFPGATAAPASTPMQAPTPTAAAPKPAPMAMVDVVSKLDKLAGENSGLDWKVSIVDLLKLLGIDSSLSARKELATELGCPPDLIGGDYAKMNVWLQKTVLQKIADNGGNIPKELLS